MEDEENMPISEVQFDLRDFDIPLYADDGAGGAPNAYAPKGNEGAHGAAGYEVFVELYRSVAPRLFDRDIEDANRALRNVFSFFAPAGCSPSAPGATPAKAPEKPKQAPTVSKLGKIRPSDLPPGSLIVNDPDKMLMVAPSRDFSLGDLVFPARSNIYLDHLDRIRVVYFSRPTVVQGFPVAEGFKTLFYPTGELGGFVLAADQVIGGKAYPGGTVLILNPKGEVTHFRKP